MSCEAPTSQQTSTIYCEAPIHPQTSTMSYEAPTNPQIYTIYCDAPTIPYLSAMSCATPTSPQTSTMSCEAPINPQTSTMSYEAPTNPHISTIYWEAPTSPYISTMSCVTPTSPQTSTMYCEAPTSPQTSTTSCASSTTGLAVILNWDFSWLTHTYWKQKINIKLLKVRSNQVLTSANINTKHPGRSKESPHWVHPQHLPASTCVYLHHCVYLHLCIYYLPVCWLSPDVTVSRWKESLTSSLRARCVYDCEWELVCANCHPSTLTGPVWEDKNT